ncbi:DUF2752 domain-containing protein [Mucilaginibacter arboris]|uniref:DUF2752 domain-containing protein n=1 Tax=Mucilaginibacter arboris TaxID=2682090 RepID=A0A7K1SV52_9SPHI|nr:DUF2752 domain-containing protein [Mucilaginibacter arboris]MVN21206.1 DUF2752 domain-containing protein [Mucilaginibacter arboris]
MDKSVEKYLLHCPFKQLTGIDCPGCGFQRSFIALLKGRLLESFHFYPATIPILLLALFLLLKVKIQLDQKGRISRALFAVAVTVVTVSYAFKVVQGRL